MECGMMRCARRCNRVQCGVTECGVMEWDAMQFNVQYCWCVLEKECLFQNIFKTGVSLGGMINFKKKFNIAQNDKKRLQKYGTQKCQKGQ